MKIIKLTSENIKRLIAVEIAPNGNFVQITGKNGHGKTSVLDSIWWALSGVKNVQSQPIRRGANQAKVKLDMGDVIVTRTFKRELDGPGYTTKLEVVGNVKGTPQAVLDSLLDSLAFDPLEFARMQPKQQVEVLKKYVPDIDFSKLAAENSIDYSARTEKARKAKELRIQAEQITVTDKTPTQRIDETALVTALVDAGKHNADIQLRQKNREQVGIDIKRWRNDIVANRERAAELRQQANACDANVVANEKLIADFEQKLANAGPLAEPIDVAALQRQVAEARAVNEQVAKLERRSKFEQEAIAIEAEVKQLTSRMEMREAKKREAIAAAKLPVEGMSFNEDTILLNGIPFDQASDAERLRISCAIAMAGNPQLRVIRVRDGSLLDDESIALLRQMCEERDYQCWIETVGDGKVGFEIRDGQLAEAEMEEPNART